MKRDNPPKVRRMLLKTVALALLPLLLLLMTGCGGSGGRQVSIPAPTGGYLNGTAPNQVGLSIIYGYIAVDGERLADVNVTVTNQNTSEAEDTTTNSEGYFSVEIAASVGDSISVTYVDPATGQRSEQTSFGISNATQAMTSNTMIAQGVAAGSGDYAYAVASDGIDSEILEIDLSTGSINSRATFANKSFNKIAVHTGLNYAAILDTANDTLYWYDLGSLENEMAATNTEVFTTQVYDVAVVRLDDATFTTDDFVAVSHAVKANDGVLTTFPIGTGATPDLGTEDDTNCIAHPADGNYPNCPGATYTITDATRIALVKDSNNWARLAVVTDYTDGGTAARAIHFVYFAQAVTGAAISFNLAAGEYLSNTLDTSDDLYAMKWYDDSTALLTDSTNDHLVVLSASPFATSITQFELNVGSIPRGIAADPDNNVTYIANEGADSIVQLDMISMELTDTSYTVVNNPTDIGINGNYLGVTLTEPAAFRTIDLTQ